MTKKEYENSKKTIENEIDYAKAYKNKGEITKLAGLMQIVDDDPLAKAVVMDNNGLACDVKNIRESIDAYEELDNVRRSSCGMAGGYGNMIYYKDTCAFFDKHKDLILQRIKDECFELGYANELDAISKFQSLKGENITLQDMMAIDKEKGECEDFKHTQIKNALSWYAGEETAFRFENLMDCKETIKPEYLKTAESRMTNYVKNKVNRLQKELTNLKNKYENTNTRGM